MCALVRRSLARSLQSRIEVGAFSLPWRPPRFSGHGVNVRCTAKFLLSFNKRSQANRCSSAWLYLGSGNLTHAGFLEKSSPQKGNAEVGVVFAINDLVWEAEEKSPKLPAVTTWLPVPSEYGHAPLVDLATGDPMPERPPDWLAPPIAWLAAEQEHGQLWLSAPDGVDEEGLILIAPDGTTACERVGAGLRWQWPSGEPPRQAQVRWGCEPSQTALNAGARPVWSHGRRVAGRLDAGRSAATVGCISFSWRRGRRRRCGRWGGGRGR